MINIKTDTNNEILINAVKHLRLRFPVAEIERATGFKKSAISGYLNNKVSVSDAFLQTFSEAFKIDLKQFGYTKGLERAEIKNPQQNSEGLEFNSLHKIIDLQAKEIEFLRELLLKK